MKSKVYSYTDQEFKQIISNSHNCSEALTIMGYVCTGGNSHALIKQRINELHLDTSHWQNNTNFKPEIPVEDYFVQGVKRSGTITRKKILKYKLLNYVCDCCGNTGTWQGNPLILQVDHINGDHNDNRLENLRFLCPNCHSQTENFAGKNVKHTKQTQNNNIKQTQNNNIKQEYCTKCGKPITGSGKTGLCPDCAALQRRVSERPSKEQLLQEIATSSFSAVGRKYNVSDKAIVKWCATYGLPTKKKEIKELYKTMQD